MKVLLVGAGWLGIPWAKALIADGHSVTATATSLEKVDALKQQGIESIVLKLEPGASIQSLPSSDVLIVTVPPSNGEAYSLAIFQLLASAAEKAGITKVIYCSSTAVYPDLCREVGVEDAADFPSLHSGVRLLRLEQVFRQNPAFQTAVLRLGGLFGPGRDPSRFIRPRKALLGAENPVNMAHLDDCISAIRDTLSKNPFSRVRNVVRVPHESRRAFYDKARLAARLPPLEWESGEMPWKKVRVD